MFFCEFPVNPHSPTKLASHIHAQTQRPLREGAEAMHSSVKMR